MKLELFKLMPFLHEGTKGTKIPTCLSQWKECEKSEYFLSSMLCAVASVMCCIQECVTSINCGMCLGYFSPWNVTDYYLIQWLEFAVDGKHRAASLLTLLKLKFCRYREIKWDCANAADLKPTYSRSNGSHNLSFRYSRGLRSCRMIGLFPEFLCCFTSVLDKISSSAQSGSLLLSILR